MPGSFATCAEVRAVYFEIISFLNGLASNPYVSDPVMLEFNDASSPPSSTNASSMRRCSALEEAKEAQASAASEMERIIINTPTDQLANFDIGALLESDVNAACDALETLLSYVEGSGSKSLFTTSASSRIIQICITTVYETHVPKPRALALYILAHVLDGLLVQQEQQKYDAKAALPDANRLISLWKVLQTKTLNPGLADAIIRVSGPLVRAIIVQGSAEGSDGDIEKWFTSWGAMMRSAGSVDNVSSSHIFFGSISFIWLC